MNDKQLGKQNDQQSVVPYVEETVQLLDPRAEGGIAVHDYAHQCAAERQEQLRKEAVNEQNARYANESETLISQIILSDGTIIKREDFGNFTLWPVGSNKPFMNTMDGRSPYVFGCVADALQDYYTKWGEGKLSPNYGAFHDFRSDGWPLCPKCGEDELSSPFAWDGKPPKPPMIAWIHAGVKCLHCGFELEKEDHT